MSGKMLSSENIYEDGDLSLHEILHVTRRRKSENNTDGGI
jgi:hypothetical protein